LNAADKLDGWTTLYAVADAYSRPYKLTIYITTDSIVVYTMLYDE